MAQISSGIGLISGIDTGSIINQLIAIESQPVKVLQTRISERQAAEDRLRRPGNGPERVCRPWATAWPSLRRSTPPTPPAATRTSLTATAATGAAVGHVPVPGRPARHHPAEHHQRVPRHRRPPPSARARSRSNWAAARPQDQTHARPAQRRRRRPARAVPHHRPQREDRRHRHVHRRHPRRRRQEDQHVARHQREGDASPTTAWSSTDTTGKTTSDLIVQDLAGGTRRRGPGHRRATPQRADTITGTNINYVGAHDRPRRAERRPRRPDRGRRAPTSASPSPTGDLRHQAGHRRDRRRRARRDQHRRRRRS